MRIIELNSWLAIKDFVDTRLLPIQYLDRGDFYLIWSTDGPIAVTYEMPKTTPASSDQSDFENNYKPNGNIPLSNSDGRIYTQNTVAPKGWSVNDINFRLKLDDSKDEFYSRNVTYSSGKPTALTNLPGFTKYWYQNDFTEVVNPSLSDFTGVGATIEYTQIDMELPFDFVIVGGAFYLTETLSSDATLWCTAVPDVPNSSRGSIPFVLDKSLSVTGLKFTLDGKTARRLNYNATNHTNKITTLIKHPVGTTAWFQGNFQIYSGAGSY